MAAVYAQGAIFQNRLSACRLVQPETEGRRALQHFQRCRRGAEHYPKKQFDGHEEMCTVIELILSLKESFKADHLANILSGVGNSIIKSYNHHHHELFGIGKDKGVRFWSAVIRQGLVLHLLDKDIERYGLISVTPAGKAFYENPVQLMLTEDREFVDGEDDDDDEMPVGAFPSAIR